MSFKEDLIKKAEKETGAKVSWQSTAEFYADTDGNIGENVFVCQAEYTFYFSDGNFTASMYAPAINFNDLATRKNAIAYVKKEVPKLRYTSPVVQLFGDAVHVFEFDDDKKVFVKIKGNQLYSLIDIAISKQKYSLTEYNKTH